MRISSVAKKAMAVTLATAVAVGSVVAVPAKNVSAAKKAKAQKVTARVFFAGQAKDADCIWVVGDGKDAPKMEKTLKLTKGKKTTVSFTIKKPSTYKVSGKSVKLKKMTGATVLTVDLVNVLSKFKKVKVSGVTVKADGKKVKCKPSIGSFEKNNVNAKNNWRVSCYNKWGNQGDVSAKSNKDTAFAFKKNLTISFTVTPK